MNTDPYEKLTSDIREAVDWAVTNGLTKAEIVKELSEAITEVQDDTEIPA